MPSPMSRRQLLPSTLSFSSLGTNVSVDGGGDVVPVRKSGANMITIGGEERVDVRDVLCTVGEIGMVVVAAADSGISDGTDSAKVSSLKTFNSSCKRDGWIFDVLPSWPLEEDWFSDSGSGNNEDKTCECSL